MRLRHAGSPERAAADGDAAALGRDGAAAASPSSPLVLPGSATFQPTHIEKDIEIYIDLLSLFLCRFLVSSNICTWNLKKTPFLPRFQPPASPALTVQTLLRICRGIVWN